MGRDVPSNGGERPPAEPEEAVPAVHPAGGRQSRPVVGIALKVTSALLFTVMVTLIKLLGDRVPSGEIVFARNFFGLVPVLAMIVLRGEIGTAFRTHRPLGHFGRAIAGTGAMLLWFESISRLPLADATAISYAAPLITLVLAVLLLGERVRTTRWLAVGLGLVGVLVVLSPHLAGMDGGEREALGALSAATAAFFMAFAMIFIRTLTGTEATATIVVYFTLASTVLSLLTLPFGWVVPSAGDATLLVFVGLIGGVAQLFLTHAYRYADASVIAPFEYTTMLWALVVGFVLFAEVPSLVVLAGAAIIVAAGLAIILRESRLGIRRPERSEAAPPKG